MKGHVRPYLKIIFNLKKKSNEVGQIEYRPLQIWKYPSEDRGCGCP
jgi:hypothetical protein